MLNVGFGEILLIAILALVVVGPERLPGLLRKAGEQYARLRRAAFDLQNAFMDEGDLLDAAGRGEIARPSRASPRPLPPREPPTPALMAPAADDPGPEAAPPPAEGA